MSSVAQINANRRNAKKSTGPKSPQGKQRVSANAVRHGLLTASTLAAGDDPAEFQEFANQLRTEYRPANALEEIQAACIIDCLWRLRRLQQVEAGAFAPVDEPARFPGVQSIGPDPHAIPPDKKAESEAVNPGAIERQSAFRARDGQFELIRRYETHLDRKLANAVKELERLQYARRDNIDPYRLQRMRRFPAVGENPDRFEPASPPRSGLTESKYRADRPLTEASSRVVAAFHRDRTERNDSWAGEPEGTDQTGNRDAGSLRSDAGGYLGNPAPETSASADGDAQARGTDSHRS
ncbi:MAG: hypothetical protein KIT09_10260 [Bryobacteraceae bacterium]|nr:hypothetical protein [Bryobacteraceae bacterium]